MWEIHNGLNPDKGQPPTTRHTPYQTSHKTLHNFITVIGSEIPGRSSKREHHPSPDPIPSKER